MIISNSFELIKVGLCTRWLISAREDDSAEDVLNEFKELENHLEKCSLTVSLNATTRLNTITDIKHDLKKLAKHDPIGKSIRASLETEITSLERIIFSESISKNIYIVPERRYNGEYLSKNPENLLKAGIFEKLPEIAKYDFISSCRCLAFGESTACAFHILRATEDVLKAYYFMYKKTKRLTKPMWGPMTTELRNKKKPRPSDTILNSLDVVRTSYRNPTQHPEITYDLDSCQDLFGVCLDLINKMAAELTN